MIGVIGATGNIGKHIINGLAERSIPSVALSRSKTSIIESVHFKKADLWDQASLEESFKGCDTIFFMIPLDPSWQDFYQKIDSALEIFLAAMKKVRPKKVVALSSLGAHLESDIGMFRMARMIEERLKQENFELTIVRPAEFMENWKHSNDTAKFSGILPNFHIPADSKFHQVSVVDIASTVLESLLSSDRPEVIHVVGPEKYSAEDARLAFEQKFSKSIQLVESPRNEWENGFQQYGMSQSYARELASLYDAINNNLITIEPNNGRIVKGARELKDVILSL